MKILVDECAPKSLKSFLSAKGHDCQTVQETGWAGKQNGELLNLAEESGFDLLVTLDTNLPHQQSWRKRKLSALLLRARTNRLPDLRPLFAKCADMIPKIAPGQLVVIENLEDR